MSAASDIYGIRADVAGAAHGDDTRLHVGTRGMSMQAAMGPRMVKQPTFFGYVGNRLQRRGRLGGYQFWRKMNTTGGFS